MKNIKNFKLQEGMELYQGMKIIGAKPMTRGNYNKYRGWTIPPDENPEDDGFMVTYEGGYISWSPKKEFDEAYRKINMVEDKIVISFSMALEALKRGFKVSRIGWNGKGMYLILDISEKDFTIERDRVHILQTNIAKYELTDCILIKTVDYKMGDLVYSPWIPSQMDMLTDDWIIVE